MTKLWMWFLLLNKRLYKKITYISILLMVPVLVVIFAVATKEPSGILTIVLANEDPSNKLATQIIQQIRNDSEVIVFLENSPEAAKAYVAAGKADAAWIFPSDMENQLRDYVYNKRNSGGFVKVIEREQTIPLLLSREKLSSVIHSRVVEETYLKYMHELAPQSQYVSDEELLSFLQNTHVSGELFSFEDIDGNVRSEDDNYLNAPIRGMLAVLITVCAMVTAMYYQSDLDHGIFHLLPERRRMFAEFGYQMISALNILAATIIALLIAALGAIWWKELALFILYSVGVSLFGMLLRMIVGGGRGMAIMLPVMSIVMLVVCPVFFDLGSLRFLQFVFPPTYFVNCAYNKMYFVYIIIYDLLLFGACFGCYWLKTCLPKKRVI